MSEDQLFVQRDMHWRFRKNSQQYVFHQRGLCIRLMLVSTKCKVESVPAGRQVVFRMQSCDVSRASSIEVVGTYKL